MCDIADSLQCYFSQRHNVTLMDSYCTAHTTFSLPCHSERSGTTVQQRTLKPTIAAQSNPAGAPAGGISALVYSIQRIASYPQNKRDSRTLQQIHTSPNTKNFPHDPATLQKQTKFSLLKRRGHGGSSREVREVWRVGTPLRKRGSCASKVFPAPSKVFPPPQKFSAAPMTVPN